MKTPQMFVNKFKFKAYDYVYIYGVSLTITYTVDSDVYIYTISNIANNHTINVTAGAADSKKIYLKNNGTWTQYSKIYIKQNGSWIEQSDWSSIFNTDANYIKRN